MPDLPELMTYEEVAEYCGVSKSAVRKWIHSKQLPVVSLSYKIKRISTDDFKKFIDLRTTNSHEKKTKTT